MILIIDNYDSFTENLAQYIGELNYKIQILRNDDLYLKTIDVLPITHIIISPGPGHPREACGSLNIIKNYAHKIPILGVCLGHQCIGEIYGGTINKLDIPMHGKISKVLHNEKDIFENISNPFMATRYHSLILEHTKLPQDLEATAWTEEGIIMACRHKIFHNLRGIQFHPESLWTNEGKKILKNFLNYK